MTAEEKREKRRLYNRETYAWRKEHGICVRCGRENACKGSVNCLQCKMDHRESAINSYNKRRSDEEYLQHRAETSKRTFYKRKEQHICIRCGKKMPDNVETGMCGICKVIVARNEREREHEKGIIPEVLRGNGEYCAVCRKPVQKRGSKLCDRCYENCCNNLIKARANVPKDCYMRKAIEYQWKCSVERRKQYEH